MNVLVRDRLAVKYWQPALLMTNIYTEERDGHLYLASDCDESDVIHHSAVLIDAIVSIEVTA